MKIKFERWVAHFSKDLKPNHGPRKWPWWRLVSFSLVPIAVYSTSYGLRLWVYTRCGAGYVGIYIDRRATQ